MRDSNRPTFRGRGRLLAPIVVAVVAASIAVACGGPTPSPTPPPSLAVATPAPTPDPHLVAPTTLEVVYKAFQDAGLKVVADTAARGQNGSDPKRRIIATYDGWPLIISEFSSVKALNKVTKWKRGKHPTQGEPPFAVKGLNILVEWGPTTGIRPPKLDAAQVKSVTAIIDALDPLLYPLAVRSTASLDLPVHTPIPTASPAASGSPAASTSP